MIQVSHPIRLTPFLMILLVLSALMLQGCGGGGGGGGGGGVTPDANPAGYYINTGTASVGDGGSGTIDISDLQAMVHGTRIMMMSAVNGLLYDGTITDITGNAFTADFTIYTDGENPVPATASGTVTAGSKIEGTLIGSGAGNGTFSLLYATTNNEVAAIARIENGQNISGVRVTWGAVIGGGSIDYEFIVEAAGDIVSDAANVNGLFHACLIGVGSTISPIVDTNLYAVSAELVGCFHPTVSMDYTGLATIQTVADDTLVFMMTSGTYSFSHDFK